MKKIAFIGGGHGLQDVIPEFLRAKFAVTAVVSVFDSGGSTGELRQRLKIPAVGDLRRVFSASSNLEIAELMESRDRSHPVGNLILTFLIQKYGFRQGLRKYSQLVNSKTVILPVTYDVAEVAVTLQGGCRLIGEHQLDLPPRKYAKQKVVELGLNKRVKLNPVVKKSLQSADAIVVGPGSLLGSLLPNFCVNGLPEAFMKSKAKKIFVAPGRPEFGYRRESTEEMAERFPVEFDEILENPGKRWEAKVLLKEIKRIL